MSRKQEIYREFLFWTLAYIRNAQSQPWWRRWRNRSAYEEAELIHNLCQSILDPDFVAHDIWFLNTQAKSYCLNARSSPLYPQHVERIRDLFRLVPEHLRLQLQWQGP